MTTKSRPNSVKTVSLRQDSSGRKIEGSNELAKIVSLEISVEVFLFKLSTLYLYIYFIRKYLSKHYLYRCTRSWIKKCKGSRKSFFKKCMLNWYHETLVWLNRCFFAKLTKNWNWCLENQSENYFGLSFKGSIIQFERTGASKLTTTFVDSLSALITRNEAHLMPGIFELNGLSWLSLLGDPFVIIHAWLWAIKLIEMSICFVMTHSKQQSNNEFVTSLPFK